MAGQRQYRLANVISSMTKPIPKHDKIVSMRLPPCGSCAIHAHEALCGSFDLFCSWQFAGNPLGTKQAETRLRKGVWVCPGVWIANWGCTQVFEHAQHWDPQPGPCTGVWDPQPGPCTGYAQVFRFPHRATHRCLDPQRCSQRYNFEIS